MNMREGIRNGNRVLSDEEVYRLAREAANNQLNTPAGDESGEGAQHSVGNVLVSVAKPTVAGVVAVTILAGMNASPAAAEGKKTSDDPKPKVVVVDDGDTLWDISRANDTTVDEILKIPGNRKFVIDPDLIHKKDKVVVENPDATPAPQAQATDTTTEPQAPDTPTGKKKHETTKGRTQIVKRKPRDTPAAPKLQSPNITPPKTDITPPPTDPLSIPENINPNTSDADEERDNSNQADTPPKDNRIEEIPPQAATPLSPPAAKPANDPNILHTPPANGRNALDDALQAIDNINPALPAPNATQTDNMHEVGAPPANIDAGPHAEVTDLSVKEVRGNNVAGLDDVLVEIASALAVPTKPVAPVMSDTQPPSSIETSITPGAYIDKDEGGIDSVLAQLDELSKQPDAPTLQDTATETPASPPPTETNPATNEPTRDEVLAKVSPQYHEVVRQKPTIEEAIKNYDSYAQRHNKKKDFGPELSGEDIARLAYAEGFRDEDLVIAVALGKFSEGGGRPFVVNTADSKNGYLHVAVGIMQILHAEEWKKDPIRDPNANLDPQTNIKNAYTIWKAQKWQPWQAFTNGDYKKYMDEAKKAVEAAGLLNSAPDDNSTVPASPEANDTASPKPEVKKPEAPRRKMTSAEKKQKAKEYEAMKTPEVRDTMKNLKDKHHNTSGLLTPQELTVIDPNKWGGHRVNPIAVESFLQMNEAYKARFGKDISLTDSYRDFALQEVTKRKKRSKAATAGRSNHGWGFAIDFGGGINTFGTAQYNWMKENAHNFGWSHPYWAEPNGGNPEAWHWEYTGLFNSTSKTSSTATVNPAPAAEAPSLLPQASIETSVANSPSPLSARIIGGRTVVTSPRDLQLSLDDLVNFLT